MKALNKRAVELFRQCALPVKSPGEMTVEKYMNAMAIDKKTVNGTIKFVLLEALGKAIVTSDYDPELLKQTLLEC